MEATLENIQTATMSELINIYNDIVVDVMDKVNTGGLYSLSGRINTLTLEDFRTHGSTVRKRFKRYLKSASNKRSLRTMNKLFNLVHKKILKLDSSPKLVCKKHEDIQKLRKEWKKYQKIADSLNKEYKDLKGDFYINNDLKL